MIRTTRNILLVLSVLPLVGIVQARTLSFEEAIGKIIERDTAIPAFVAQKEAFEMQELSRKLSFLPDLRTGYSQSRAYEFDRRQRELSVSAELNIFRGGQDFSLLKSTQASLRASSYRIEKRQLEIERDGGVLLLAYIETKLRAEIFNELAEINRTSLEVIRERARRGLVPEQEVLKAEIDFQNAKAQSLGSIIELEERKAQLSELLGHDDIVTDWPFMSELREFDKENLSEVLSSLSNRPDLKELEQAHLSAQENQRAVKRSFLPSIDFSHTWSRYGRDSFDDSERTALLSVSFPLFEGWRTRTLSAERRTEVVRTKYELTAQTRKALSELQSSHQNLLRYVETARDRERTLELANRVFESNFRRYQEGRASVNDLQIDQNRLLDSRLLANRGWFEAHQGVLEFCFAQGLRLADCQSLVFKR